MKAIILAAGRGSRMKNFTDERPKCLVEVRGKCLLDLQLESLREAGISEIGIITGYKRELLNARGLFEFHNSRWAETQMMSSLVRADEWLKKEPCIVSYSDIFYSHKAINSLLESGGDIALTYDKNWLNLWKKRFGDPLIDAESFKLNPNQTISEIGRKPKSLGEIQGQYMGLMYFTPDGWREVKRIYDSLSEHQQDNIHMTGIFQKVIEAGIVSVCGVQYTDTWGEVDSPDDLKIY